MLSFECIKNEKSVYFLLTSAAAAPDIGQLAPEPDAGLNVDLFLQSDIGQSGICEGTPVHSPTFVLPVIPV